MKSLILLLLATLFVSSCYNPTPLQIMDDFSVIEGKWISYKGIKFNEDWKFINKTEYEGVGYSLNNNDTAYFERLKMHLKDGAISYMVMFENGESVEFNLISSTKNSWVFTNPMNDYPSLIKYEVSNDTLLTVVTANIRNNKKQYFYLSRAN